MNPPTTSYDGAGGQTEIGVLLGKGSFVGNEGWGDYTKYVSYREQKNGIACIKCSSVEKCAARDSAFPSED